MPQIPTVRVFKRCFDTHAKEWRYAVEETQIVTHWILARRDYQVSDALVSELARLDPNAPRKCLRYPVDYAIFSPASLYPADTMDSVERHLHHAAGEIFVAKRRAFCVGQGPTEA